MASTFDELLRRQQQQALQPLQGAGIMATAPGVDIATSPLTRQPTYQPDPNITSLIARRRSPIAAVAASAPSGDSGLLSRLLPSTSAEIGSDVRAIGNAGGPGEVIGTGIRSTANIARNLASDWAQPAMRVGGAVADQASGFLRGVTGDRPVPAAGNAVSPPGQRAATPVTGQSQSAPIAPVAGAPAAPGSIAAVGAQASAASTPAATGFDAETAASKVLTQRIYGPTGDIDNTVDRGNAGLNAMSRNPATLQAFNNVQAARGNDITATRDANGAISISGKAPTLPQNFTQGYDLAANNAKQRASLDAGYAADAAAKLADLTAQAGEATGARQESLLRQVAALSGIQTQGKGAIASAGLQAAQAGQATAQAGLANAQTGQTTQSTAATAAAAKKMGALQDRYTSETDPTKQKALGDQLLVMLGKDPRQGKVQIAIQEEPDPSNPMAMKKVPYLIDTESGKVQRVDEAAAAGTIGGKAPGNGLTPPQNHIDALKKNPNMAAQFDAQYGPGAAKKVLGA